MNQKSYPSASGKDAGVSSDVPSPRPPSDAGLTQALDPLTPAKPVFVQNHLPRLRPIQKGLALLQINMLVNLVLTFLGQPFNLRPLLAFESQPWHLWALIGCLSLSKFVIISVLKTRSASLKWAYGVDLALNTLLGLICGLILQTTSSDALRTALLCYRVFILGLFCGLCAFQVFLWAQVRLTIVTLAFILSSMTLAQVICFGFVAALSDRLRMGVRGTFFGVMFLAVANTYFVLITQFLERFRPPSNNALGALTVYFRVQSDWSFQFWVDFARMVSVGADLACHDPAKAETGVPPPEALDLHHSKETADRVDLSDSDLEDKLSVSAMY